MSNVTMPIGQSNNVWTLLSDFKVSWDCNAMSSFTVIRQVPSKTFIYTAALSVTVFISLCF